MYKMTARISAIKCQTKNYMCCRISVSYINHYLYSMMELVYCVLCLVILSNYECQTQSIYSDMECMTEDDYTDIMNILQKLTKKVQDMENRIMSVETKRMDKIKDGFTVSWNQGKVKTGKRLVFDEVSSNINDLYNNETGLLAVNKKGVYVFNLIIECPKNAYVCAGISKDGKILCKACCSSSDTFSFSATMLVDELQPGTIIQVNTYRIAKGNTLGDQTTFSGFLL